MLARWLNDLESLEAISQDEETRRIFLRMAALSKAGRLGGFLDVLACDDELDENMKDTLEELASDEGFLLAVEDYLRRTLVFH